MNRLDVLATDAKTHADKALAMFGVFVCLVLHTDFAYHADRLIPCVQLTYAVTSTSPWHGLSALELLIRSQLRLRVYSVIESPKYFKAKLTRYCS